METLLQALGYGILGLIVVYLSARLAGHGWYRSRLEFLVKLAKTLKGDTHGGG